MTGAVARWPRWLAIGVALVVGLVVAAIGLWVLLFPDAEQGPLAAVRTDPDLTVTINDDGASVEPAEESVRATVVFYPGAGVPPEAYLPTWAPVVEQEMIRVIVPAMPLRLAVLDSDAAAGARDDADDDGRWWLGGHSLGGAMAASFLADAPAGRWEGLILWAAYPAGDGLADREDLTVVSIAGSQDGLTRPDEVEASLDELPPTTRFRVLDGVNHAQFGAYGDQRGDDPASIDDDVARDLIARTTAEAVAAGS